MEEGLKNMGRLVGASLINSFGWKNMVVKVNLSQYSKS